MVGECSETCVAEERGPYLKRILVHCVLCIRQDDRTPRARERGPAG